MSDTLSLITFSNNQEKLNGFIRWARNSKFFDEIIIVVDHGFSVPCEILEKCDVCFETQPGYIEYTEHLYICKGSSDWVLRLDDDERIVEKPQLVPEYDHLWMPRYWLADNGNHYPHLYPDHQLRLYRRGFTDPCSRGIHIHPKGLGRGGYSTTHLYHMDIVWSKPEDRVKKVYRNDFTMGGRQEWLRKFYLPERFPVAPLPHPVNIGSL